MRNVQLIIVLLVLMVTPTFAGWVYDNSPIFATGASVGYGTSTLAVAQSVYFSEAVMVNQIGVAIAQQSDPNHAGFKVTLAEDYMNPYNTMLGTWNIRPVLGPTVAFAYQSFDPISLNPGNYYVVLEPGDSSFKGAAAFALYGDLGLAYDGKDWGASRPFGVRIGGAVVPEPSGLLILSFSIPIALLRLRNRRI